jgi:hypothetical protein
MDKKIYHERNGEIVIHDADEFYVFQKARCSAEELVSYKTDESPYGYFRVTLYFKEGQAWREWLWIPSIGYNWSEYIVEVIS